MKKLFTLCAAAIMGSVMAFAQSDYTPTENVFQFVDEDGAVVADGTTWEVYEKHDSLINLPGLDPMDMGTMVLSGLSVKNTAEGDVYCAVDFQVTQIDGGTFQICFPSKCQGVSSVTDVLSTDAGIVSAGSTKDMLTEWVIRPMNGNTEVTGVCKATLQLKTMRQVQTGEVGGYPIYGYELVAMGPKVDIIFHNDGTNAGISGVAPAGKQEAEAYYSLDGRRRDVPQKGLNIVKYADGSAKKVIVK